MLHPLPPSNNIIVQISPAKDAAGRARRFRVEGRRVEGLLNPKSPELSGAAHVCLNLFAYSRRLVNLKG